MYKNFLSWIPKEDLAESYYTVFGSSAPNKGMILFIYDDRIEYIAQGSNKINVQKFFIVCNNFYDRNIFITKTNDGLEVHFKYAQEVDLSKFRIFDNSENYLRNVYNLLNDLIYLNEASLFRNVLNEKIQTPNDFYLHNLYFSDKIPIFDENFKFVHLENFELVQDFYKFRMPNQLVLNNERAINGFRFNFQ